MYEDIVDEGFCLDFRNGFGDGPINRERVDYFNGGPIKLRDIGSVDDRGRHLGFEDT